MDHLHEALNDLVSAVHHAGPGRVLVGIDGVDGVGKTTVADALADVLRRRGHDVIRVCMDDFLYPREHRYARGRDSAEGFYRDSVNVKDFLAGVVTPLSMPDARIRTAAFDHVRDLPIEADPVAVPSEGIVVVDGIFLHRRELAAVWDVSVFLDAPFTVTVPRMARRDGGSPDPRDASNRRYVGGQRLYLDECRPTHLATVVVDMTDLSAPRVVPGADRDSWAIPDDLP